MNAPSMNSDTPVRKRVLIVDDEGRVAAVADVFDALTRDRVYRGRVSMEEAIVVIRDSRGGHFDGDVADAFVQMLAEQPAVHGGAGLEADER